MRYAWPGNVRELRNAMHRAVVLAGNGAIMREHLPPRVVGGALPPGGAAPESGKVLPLRDVERQMIVRALEETNYHKPQAAAMLGISLKTLYNKLARFGLPPNRAAASVMRSELDTIDHVLRGALNTVAAQPSAALHLACERDEQARPLLDRASPSCGGWPRSCCRPRSESRAWRSRSAGVSTWAARGPSSAAITACDGRVRAGTGSRRWSADPELLATAARASLVSNAVAADAPRAPGTRHCHRHERRGRGSRSW